MHTLLILLCCCLVHVVAAVPTLDLALWNRAWQLRVENLPLPDAAAADAADVLRQLGLPPSCTADSSTADPVAAPLNACFYSLGTAAAGAAVLSWWQKLPGDLRSNTNCYCYALDRHTANGFCTPGTSQGIDKQWARDGGALSCESLKAAVTADGGTEVASQAALGQDTSGGDSDGHFIALLTRGPGCDGAGCWAADYHALRRDSNGLWSGKEAGGPASNLDLQGRTITDPQVSEVAGHYAFCAFFHVRPDSLKVAVSNPWPGSSLQDRARQLRQQAGPGATVSLAPLQYNPTTDGVSQAAQHQLQAASASGLQAQQQQQQQQQQTQQQQQQQQTQTQSGGGSESSTDSRSPPSSNSGAQTGRRLLQPAW